MVPACSSIETPVQETLPPTQPASQLTYYPLDTTTNIPQLDVVLKAVAGGDAQELRALFEYAKIPCMTVYALGGPPACPAGEAEGTVVEVLPSLGPEGSFLRREEAEKFPALNVIGLYAIYHVPASVHSDANYPAGKNGIVYLSVENAPELDLQVTDGRIVRIDYIFGYPESNQLLPPGVTDFVLAPLSK